MAVMALAVSILATNLRVWATHPIAATIAAGAAWTAGGAAAVSVDPILLFGMLALVPTLTFARPAVRPRPARPPAPCRPPVMTPRRSPGAEGTPAAAGKRQRRVCHQTPGAPVPADMTADAPGRQAPRPVHVTGDHLSGPAGARLCQCRAFPMARGEADCPNHTT